jgi:hypothetical protein
MWWYALAYDIDDHKIKSEVVEYIKEKFSTRKHVLESVWLIGIDEPTSKEFIAYFNHFLESGDHGFFAARIMTGKVQKYEDWDAHNALIGTSLT